MKRALTSGVLTVLLLSKILVAHSDDGPSSAKDYPKDCSHLHEGAFHVTLESGLFLIFERDDRFQTTYRLFPDRFKRAKIEWHSSCEYTLTVIQDEDPGLGQTVGFSYRLRIVRIGDDFYDVQHQFQGNEEWIPASRVYKADSIETAAKLQELKNN